MPLSLVPSFLIYCFTCSITPGPANLCSLNTAMSKGRSAALIQWRGLFIGFAIVSFVTAFLSYFLGNVLGDAVRYLSYIGAAYLLYLAIQTLLPLFGAGHETTHAAEGQGTFVRGLIVQLTNVKIMIYCMTIFSSYVLPYSRKLSSLLLMAAFLPFTGPVCNLVWLFAGVRLQRIFLKYRTPVSLMMALSLAYCAISLIL